MTEVWTLVRKRIYRVLFAPSQLLILVVTTVSTFPLPTHALLY